MANPESLVKIDIKLSDALLRKHFHLRFSNEGNKVVTKIVNQAEAEAKKPSFKRSKTRQVNFQYLKFLS
jgi:hypothetical protein